MKINKGFIAQLFVAILISLSFIGLGNWQLNRAHDVQLVNLVTPDLPQIPLEDVAEAATNLEASAINRIVTVSGKYAQTFLAPKQEIKRDGQTSLLNLEVRLLVLEGRRGILVVRGISESKEQEISGELKIIGRLYPRQTSDSARAVKGELSRIDPGLIAGAQNLSLFDGYIIATSEISDAGQEIAASRIPAPQLKSKVAGNYWQHISYVFIWWLMALITLLGPFYNSIKERQTTEESQLGGKVEL